MGKTFSELEKFLYSFAVVNFLRNRSWLSASFIEYIILSCIQIDAMLRWAVVLKDQIDNENTKINKKWIKKNLKERIVFQEALCKNIINKKLYRDLNDLYSQRNAIVHRFMITDLDYEYAKRIASEFEPGIVKLQEILHKLEAKQLKDGVGITRSIGTLPNKDNDFEKKLGSYFNFKMGDSLERINKVRFHKWPDVEDIVEFVSRRGYFKKCKNCEHEKIHHVHFGKNNFRIGNCKITDCNCKNFIPKS